MSRIKGFFLKVKDGVEWLLALKVTESERLGYAGYEFFDGGFPAGGRPRSRLALPCCFTYPVPDRLSVAQPPGVCAHRAGAGVENLARRVAVVARRRRRRKLSRPPPKPSPILVPIPDPTPMILSRSSHRGDGGAAGCDRDDRDLAIGDINALQDLRAVVVSAVATRQDRYRHRERGGSTGWAISG